MGKGGAALRCRAPIIKQREIAIEKAVRLICCKFIRPSQPRFKGSTPKQLVGLVWNQSGVNVSRLSTVLLHHLAQLNGLSASPLALIGCFHESEYLDRFLSSNW